MGLLPILLSACAGSAANHERLGDGHYREGAYPEAVLEYRSAQRSAARPALWGKLGLAALRAGDAATAVEAFQRLGTEDPTRAAEAARGLERAARLAGRSGPGAPALTAALVALRGVAPDRPLGRLAREAGDEVPGSEALASLLPAAIAAADPGRDVDRLLLRYADGLRARTACDQATRVYHTAMRRNRDLATREAAGRGLADCALRLGLEALAADRFDAAEGWFADAVVAQPSGPLGLRARIAWGDARFQQGDLLGAAISWEGVRSMPGAPDSLRQLAQERISGLGSAGRGDSIP